MKGVIDSGANIGVVPSRIAARLGLVVEKEKSGYGVRFGDDEVVMVDRVVRGAGFVGKFAVLDGAAAVLFPIKAWISRGLIVTFSLEGMTVATPNVGRVLYRCGLDPRTALFMGDFKQLLGMRCERLTSEEVRPAAESEAAFSRSSVCDQRGVAYLDIVEGGQVEVEEAVEEDSGAGDMVVAGGGQSVRGRSQRRWAAKEIELARRVHVGSGHGHFTTLQEICRNGCWDHIPEGIDWPGLFADVGRKLPCVWCRLANTWIRRWDRVYIRGR